MAASCGKQCTSDTIKPNKMNNSQFRNLILDNDKSKDGKSTSASNATSSSLGTKKSGFIPMTPRAVKGGIDVDFARQVRERNAALQPTKKYKSAAPKGVKYAAGYTDRAKARAETEGDEDDKANRIKALEEQMKLGQISPETFESLRDQITGGDISSTHLVKGLDRQLLERVRRGEDVLGTGAGTEEKRPMLDVDDELDKLGEKDVEAVKKENVEKKGNMAPPALAGKKRTRDELMAELKAQRRAVAEAKAAPLLSGKWRRVGEEQKGRIEIDSKGREVLITVDEDGVLKKKVRKTKSQAADGDNTPIAMPDASKDVLGSDVVVPEAPALPSANEESDDDIFEGAGTEYNPLGNEDDDSDSDSSEKEVANDENAKPRPIKPSSNHKDANTDDSAPTVPDNKPRVVPRNYFKDSAVTAEEDSVDRQAGIQDLLKKAAKMDPLKSLDEDGESNEAEKARVRRRAEMLAQQDRDMEDMDMGFGGGRYDDEGEDEGKKMRLSEWKGSVGEDDEGYGEGAKDGNKKKRKPKKRKGDVNNAADIMRVIEGRKGGK